MKILNIKVIYIVLSVLFGYGCNTDKSTNNNIETINIENLEPSTMPISQFAESMEIVKFETRDDCLLGGITHMKLSSKYIYIKDMFFNGLYVFDKKGNFIKKLQNDGQGPGEYLEISDFIVDEQSNTLEIYDTRSDKLVIYSLLDFSFIKNLPIKLTASFSVIKKIIYTIFAVAALEIILMENPLTVK